MSGIQWAVNIAGLSLSLWIIWYFWLWTPTSKNARAQAGGDFQEAEITVKGGYQPAIIMAKAGKPLRLKVTRKESSTCGEEMVFADFGKRVHLPEGEAVTFELLPESAGVFGFNCPMSMYRGKLIVEA